MTIVEKPVSAETFFRLQHPNSRLELVYGAVIELPFNGGIHGNVVVSIAARLEEWANREKHGEVGVGSGFILARDPDTVRSLDAFFIRADRITALGGVPEGFWRIPPDLAVEVVSPHESADDVREKVRDYLLAGTPLVWVVYPRTREVIEHTPDGLARTRTETDTLENEAVLPNFSCIVRELFE